jgi:glutamate 5-kinase
VGQVLITKDVVDNKKMYQNAVNTFSRLLEYGVIPIVNENDTISTDEIEFGDNDTLSAYVAKIVGADLLIILTDIDGLYDKNPNEAGAKFISEVKEITDEIRQIAGGAGSERGVGGMKTKIMAADIASEAGVKTIIMSGENPKKIYDVLGGEEIGTFFNI